MTEGGDFTVTMMDPSPVFSEGSLASLRVAQYVTVPLCIEVLKSVLCNKDIWVLKP